MILSPEQNLKRLLSKPAAAVNLKLRGQFKVMVHREGQLVQETDWFDNLILDQGLDYLGTMSLMPSVVYPNGPMGYAHIGTGTSPAVTTQTSLENYLMGVSYANTNFFENEGPPNYKSNIVQYYRFAQGAVVGGVSEVGVGRQITDGQLFSRARLVDSNGNPTTIVITAVDQLTIAYQLTIVPNTQAVVGSVVLEGVTYNWSAYMTGINNLGNAATNLRMPTPNSARPFMGVPYAQNLVQGVLYGGGTPLSPSVLVDNNVPGATATLDITGQATSNITYAYTTGSYTATSTLSLVPSVGNVVGGIQCIQIKFAVTDIDIGFRVLYYFNAPIPKTNTKLLRFEFVTSWSR